LFPCDSDEREVENATEHDIFDMSAPSSPYGKISLGQDNTGLSSESKEDHGTEQSPVRRLAFTMTLDTSKEGLEEPPVFDRRGSEKRRFFHESDRSRTRCIKDKVAFFFVFLISSSFVKILWSLWLFVMTPHDNFAVKGFAGTVCVLSIAAGAHYCRRWRIDMFEKHVNADFAGFAYNAEVVTWLAVGLNHAMYTRT